MTFRPCRWKCCLVCRTISVLAGSWIWSPKFTLEAPRGGMARADGAYRSIGAPAFFRLLDALAPTLMGIANIWREHMASVSSSGAATSISVAASRSAFPVLQVGWSGLWFVRWITYGASWRCRRRCRLLSSFFRVVGQTDIHICLVIRPTNQLGRTRSVQCSG